MSQLFTTVLTQPILNLLLWLYDVLPGHDIGIAIIALTILVKLLLHPFSVKQIKQQRAMQELQPKIDAVRNTYKDNKEEQARQLMALYKAEKVNPASSCLPLLIQLPIFIALFRVLLNILQQQDFSLLYTFVPHPGQIDPRLFGIVDLHDPNYAMAVVSGIVQFIQSRQMLKTGATRQPPADVKGSEAAKDESMAAMMNKQMMYVMPVVTVIIGFSLPGGLTLYWLTMSVLTVFQQWYMFKTMPPNATPAAALPTSEPQAETPR